MDYYIGYVLPTAVNGKGMKKGWVSCAISQTCPFLVSVPNIPLHDKKDRPSWRKWSYYSQLLPFLSVSTFVFCVCCVVFTCEVRSVIVNCPKSTTFGENGRSKMQDAKTMIMGIKKCNQHGRSDNIIIPLIIFKYRSL